jgi:hypothetical protein
VSCRVAARIFKWLAQGALRTALTSCVVNSWCVPLFSFLLLLLLHLCLHKLEGDLGVSKILLGMSLWKVSFASQYLLLVICAKGNCENSKQMSMMLFCCGRCTHMYQMAYFEDNVVKLFLLITPLTAKPSKKKVRLYLNVDCGSLCKGD